MKFWPFKSAPPSIEDCGRRLAEYRCLNARERVKERARLMREAMGLQPDPRLEPRG